jgi:hypothetical protein
MKKFIFAVCVGAASLLMGCGGSQSVIRTNTPSPEIIKTAALSPLAGNSPEVDSYIAEALLIQGVSANPPLPAGTRKSNDVDAIVTYLDVWKWDMAMFLKSISISFYDARTGALLVTGKWSDSFFHGYHRGESVSKDLIAEMLAKLGSKTDK